MMRVQIVGRWLVILMIGLATLPGRSFSQETNTPAKPQAASPASAGDDVGGLGYQDRFDQSTVAVDVFVRDNEDQSVTGLKREQFRLFQDGVEVELTDFAAFTQEDFNVLQGVKASVAPEAGTTVKPKPIYIVIYVDNRNLRSLDRNHVLRALRGFSEILNTGVAQIMVISYDGAIELVQNFTDDQRKVQEALRYLRTTEAALDERDDEHDHVRQAIRRVERTSKSSLSYQRSLSDVYTKIREYAQEQDRILEESLSAFRESMSVMSGINGRRYFIYVSNGVPLILARDLLHEFAGLNERTSRSVITMPYTKKNRYDALAASANAQEITFHMIDASGSQNRTGEVGDANARRSASAAVIYRENRQAPLRLLSEKTGGLAILNTDDYEAGLERIKADLLTYYAIGYQTEPSGGDTVHQIKVQVEGDQEFDIRYRRTFVERSIYSQIQDEVTAGLYFDVEDNPLGIEVEQGPVVPVTETQFMHPLTVEIPVHSLAMQLEGDEYVGRAIVYFALRNLDGRNTDVQRQEHDFRLPIDEYERRQGDRFPVYLRLLLESGTHRIVIGVLDDTTRQVSMLRLEASSPEPPKEP